MPYIKTIFILFSVIISTIVLAQVDNRINNITPQIKKLWFNKMENSFYWALINEKDTIRIIKTYDGGTELIAGSKFLIKKLDFVTYELEDFGSGLEMTIFFDNKQHKFYSIRYNLNGLENEKLIYSTVDFKLKKIMVGIKSIGVKSKTFTIRKLKELLPILKPVN